MQGYQWVKKPISNSECEATNGIPLKRGSRSGYGLNDAPIFYPLSLQIISSLFNTREHSLEAAKSLALPSH